MRMYEKMKREERKIKINKELLTRRDNSA